MHRADFGKAVYVGFDQTPARKCYWGYYMCEQFNNFIKGSALTHTHTHTRARARAHTHTPFHIHTHTHTRAHTHTHTHTHARTQAQPHAHYTSFILNLKNEHMFTRNIATEEAIKSDRTQIKARVILSAQLFVPQLTHSRQKQELALQYMHKS